MFRLTRLTLILLLILIGAGISGAEEALVRIDRHSPADRNALVEKDVLLVAEMDDCFLAFGDSSMLKDTCTALGLTATVIDAMSAGSNYALAGFGDRAMPKDLESCGEAVYTADGWAVLRVDGELPLECFAMTNARVRRLDRVAMKPAREVPTQWLAFSQGRSPVTVDPLVEGMVSGLTDNLAMAHWQGIVDMASTRYSTSSGCETATTTVEQLFGSYGLQTELQHHTTGHAPNVIGTLAGGDLADETVILIGHLDDLPSSGAAPGADDNASGSAMVTALAEVMSCSTYRRTVRFIAVTGEEFGLYGSTYYAGQAASEGEQITAVLNADMIGWEGDGIPAVEDLDLNQNTASEWLGNLFAQLAEDYETGAVINNFTCNSMQYSDHWPFWQEGYASLCGITDNEGFCGHGGNYGDYHQSSDTIANCGPGAPAFIGSAMRAHLATAAVLSEPVSSVVSSATGLLANADGDNRVVVSWTAPEPGMSFSVRRMPGGCADPGPVTELGTTADTTFTDVTPSGGVTYGYQVRAAQTDGPCASGWSECVEAVTTGECSEPPEFAGATSAVNQGTVACGVEVSWQPARPWCGDAVSYSVYRSTEADFLPSPENLVESDLLGSPWLDDGDMAPGVTNYWVVRAIDHNGGGADDNTVHQAVRPTGPVTMGAWFDDAENPGDGFLALEQPWKVLNDEGLDDSDAYGTDVYPSNMCSAATTPELTLGDDPMLTFWSHYDIESEWDKGEVQISTDGGITWERLELAYPALANISSSDACGFPEDLYYFTSTSSSWSLYDASLADWAGLPVRIRWALSSDGFIEGDGWWLDDLSISPAGVPEMCIPNGSPIFVDGFESGDTSAW